MSGLRPPGDRPRAADLRWLALLALAPLLFYWPFLFGSQVLYYRDVTQVYQPDILFIQRSLAAGQLPFWNPLVAGGYPHLAGLEPSLFYPGLLAFLLLPFGPGLALLLALHQLLAGWAMYALGRAWGWRREAAALAAVTYACSGYIAASGQLYPLVPRAAWFPLVVLLYERALRGRGVIPLIACWAMAMSLARPDTTLIELLPLGALALVRGWQASGGWRERVRPAVLLGLALAAGLALNAACILPALQFVANSNREAGITLAESQTYSFPPLGMLTLAAPGLFGDVEWGTDWGRYFLGEPQAGYSMYFLTLYLGWLPWLLLPLAWRARRHGRWLIVVAVLGLALALGSYLPFFAWFSALVPGAGFVRYPAKFWFVTTWCLAAAAGAGADELQRRPGHHARLVLGLAGASGLALLGWATSFAWPGRWIGWLAGLDYRDLATGPPGFDPNVYMARLWPVIFSDVRAQLGTALALACLGAGMLALASRPTGSLARWAPHLLVIVALVDLVGRNRGFNFAAPAAYFDRVPPVVVAARALGGPEPSRFFKPLGQMERLGDPHANRRADLARARGVPYALAYSAALQDRLSARAALAYSLPGVYGGTNLTPYFSATFLLENLDRLTPGGAPAGRLAAVAGLLNVRLLLIPYTPGRGGAVPPLPARLRDPIFPEVWRDDAGGVLLLENRRWRPRAYLVPQALVVPDLDAATRAVGVVDPAKVVIVEGLSPTPDPSHQGRGLAFDERSERQGPRSPGSGNQPDDLKQGPPGPRDRPPPPESQSPPLVGGVRGGGTTQRGPRDQPPPSESQSPPPAGGVRGGGQTVRLLATTNHYVAASVVAPRGGFLVLADNYYPGWRAYLDGQPVSLLRANVVARAVAVPPGNHRVEFRYLPSSVFAGVAISLAGWLMLLVLWARRRWAV